MSSNAVSIHLLNTPRDGDSVTSLGIGKFCGNRPSSFLVISKIMQDFSTALFILLLLDPVCIDSTSKF